MGFFACEQVFIKDLAVQFLCVGTGDSEDQSLSEHFMFWQDPSPSFFTTQTKKLESYISELVCRIEQE